MEGNEAPKPNIGDRVISIKEDHGDAGLRLPIGAKGHVSKVEFDPTESDWNITVMFDDPSIGCEGGWGLLAEYGPNGDDYYEGMTMLETFWDLFKLDPKH